MFLCTVYSPLIIPADSLSIHLAYLFILPTKMRERLNSNRRFTNNVKLDRNGDYEPENDSDDDIDYVHCKNFGRRSRLIANYKVFHLLKLNAQSRTCMAYKSIFVCYRTVTSDIPQSEIQFNKIPTNFHKVT